MLYAGCYPERVNNLVLIEGFGPVTKPSESVAETMRKAIDSQQSFYKKKTTKSGAKNYENIRVAIAARIASVKSYPGSQTISQEAASILVARLLCLTDLVASRQI